MSLEVRDFAHVLDRTDALDALGIAQTNAARIISLIDQVAVIEITKGLQQPPRQRPPRQRKFSSDESDSDDDMGVVPATAASGGAAAHNEYSSDEPDSDDDMGVAPGLPTGPGPRIKLKAYWYQDNRGKLQRKKGNISQFEGRTLEGNQWFYLLAVQGITTIYLPLYNIEAGKLVPCQQICENTVRLDRRGYKFRKRDSWNVVIKNERPPQPPVRP